MPMPEVTPQMGEYMCALLKVGFLFPIIAIIEIIAGISFILNKYAALFSIVVFPIMLNAFLAHLFLDPAGIGGAAVVTLALVIVMLRYKNRYIEIFKV